MFTKVFKKCNCNCLCYRHELYLDLRCLDKNNPIDLHLWERPKLNLGTKTSKTWVGLLSWARNKLFASAWHFFCIDHKHHRWFIFSKTFCILKFGQFSLIPLLAQKLFFLLNWSVSWNEAVWCNISCLLFEFLCTLERAETVFPCQCLTLSCPHTACDYFNCWLNVLIAWQGQLLLLFVFALYGQNRNSFCALRRCKHWKLSDHMTIKSTYHLQVLD